MFRRRVLASWLFATTMVAASVPSQSACAEDNVVRRLTECGELAPADARALQEHVSAAMRRAAANADPNDPVRAALTQSLVPAGSEAKQQRAIERRLRAGLDLWALDGLFDPDRSSVETCSRLFDLSAMQCGALLAAARRETRAATLARRKEEYRQQREAFLNRSLAQLKERRARVLAASDNGPVQRGPASELEAEVVGLARKRNDPVPAANTPVTFAAKAPANKEQAVGEVEAASEIDLHDLIADPLGKNAPGVLVPDGGTGHARPGGSKPGASATPARPPSSQAPKPDG
jgi:hypothetical protein